MIAVESAVGRAADPQTPYEVRRGPCGSPPKTDAPRHPHPDARVLPIIGGRFETNSTVRREGDIRDSGCPAAVRIANFRRKTRAQHNWRRTRQYQIYVNEIIRSYWRSQ